MNASSRPSFVSRTVDVAGSSIHHVEAGSGPPVLFLHGNPTSSYLWRDVMPHVADRHRAIAMDLIGMGRSDKPDIDYRFFDHVRYVDGFIDALGLEDLVLVVHDWGSALGFHYARRYPDRVRGLAFMEAILAPVPSWESFPEDFREAFRAFRDPERGRELLIEQNAFVEQVLPRGIVRQLEDEEMERYREPYRDPSDRTPIWRWPNEVPIEGEPADVQEAVLAYNAWLQQTDIPKLLLHAKPGALVPPPVVQWCESELSELETVDLGHGLHYLQEDHPHAIGEALGTWLDGLEAVSG